MKFTTIVLDNGCWITSLKLNNKGYARTTFDGKLKYVHIYNYEQLHGSVPEGCELDHKCRTPACVNPSHMEPVTHQENVLRGKVLKYGPEILEQVVNLSKQGLGYRRIGKALGIHYNSALYLLKRLGIKKM